VSETFFVALGLVIVTAPFWGPAFVIGRFMKRRKRERNYERLLDRRLDRALIDQDAHAASVIEHNEPQPVQQRLEVHHHYHGNAAPPRDPDFDDLPPAARPRSGIKNNWPIPPSKRLR